MTMQPHSDAFMFSASEVAPHVRLDQGMMTIDAEANTAMYRFSGDPREVDFLRFDATALAYFIRHQGRSAVIGVGGGRDLLTASIFGFRDITGVDYNPIFVRLFDHDYRDFSGAGKIPGLRLAVDDARSWFARSREQFDLIQMSMIDSWAGTTAGAFTISANPMEEIMNVKRITPVLFVKEIEPVLPFWVDALGFAKAIEVPHGNKLGFVALQKETTEVMYQSYASLGEDMPLISEAARKGPTFLYIEVDNLDAVLTVLKSSQIVQPERTAFYGMREVGYQDPAGHYITFAQAVAAAR